MKHYRPADHSIIYNEQNANRAMIGATIVELVFAAVALGLLAFFGVFIGKMISGSIKKLFDSDNIKLYSYRANQVYHFNCTLRTVKTFVARLGSSAFNCLLKVLRREHTEHYRNSAGKRRLRNTF